MSEPGGPNRQRGTLFVLVGVLVVALLVIVSAQIIGGCWIDVGNEMGHQPSVGYVEPPRSSAAEGAVPIQGLDVIPGAPPPANPVGSSDASQADGKDLYAVFCLPCHGEPAGETGPVGKEFVPPPPHLDQVVGSLTDGQVFVFATQGVGRMPALGSRMSVTDRWNIVNYLRTVQGSTATTTVGATTTTAPAGAGTTTTTAPPAGATTTTTVPPSGTTTTTMAGGADPALVAKGLAVFDANCLACHGADGAGGVGPKLKPNAFVGASADAAVRQVIENGRAGTAMPAWQGRLSADDTTAVVALLRSWQGARTAGATIAAAADEATVPFTHRPHMQKGGLSCVFCHSQVRRGPSADLPPLELCAGCHKWLSVQTPATRAVVAAYDAGVEVSWARVYKLPDFVYFTHQSHVVVAKVECATCHGDVAQMALAQKAVRLNMKFCIGCHAQQTEQEQLMDCDICHK